MVYQAKILPEILQDKMTKLVYTRYYKSFLYRTQYFYKSLNTYQ